MDDQTVESFACPSCGAKFAYKPPPGRKVLCTCGHAFLPDQVVYDITEDDAAPAVSSDVPASEPEPAGVPHSSAARVSSVTPAAKHAPSSPAAQQPASVASCPPPAFAAYPRRPNRAPVVVDDELSPSRARDVILPAALSVAGLVIWLGRVSAAPPAGMHPGAAVLLALCQMVVTVAMALAAGAISLRFIDTGVGHPGRAALKMSAAALFAAAAAVFAISLDHDRGHVAGVVVALNLVFLLYAVLLRALFRLDVQETLLASVIILLFQIAAAAVVMRG